MHNLCCNFKCPNERGGMQWRISGGNNSGTIQDFSVGGPGALENSGGNIGGTIQDFPLGRGIFTWFQQIFKNIKIPFWTI